LELLIIINRNNLLGGQKTGLPVF